MYLPVLKSTLCYVPACPSFSPPAPMWALPGLEGLGHPGASSEPTLTSDDIMWYNHDIMMMWWYHDVMIQSWYYDDVMIQWWCDMFICVLISRWYHDDVIISWCDDIMMISWWCGDIMMRWYIDDIMMMWYVNHDDVMISWCDDIIPREVFWIFTSYPFKYADGSINIELLSPPPSSSSPSSSPSSSLSSSLAIKLLEMQINPGLTAANRLDWASQTLLIH